MNWLKPPLQSAIALSITVVGASGLHAEDSRDQADTANATLGASVYQQTCQGCHMPDGQGAQGAGSYPALAHNPRLAAWEYVAITVLNGRNAMPRFGLPPAQPPLEHTYQLSDREIAAVVNYVMGRFAKGRGGRATEADVAALPHPTTLLRP